MKIGILTQPLRNNYGGILQNYALQKIILQRGHNVETLDYVSQKRSMIHRLISLFLRNILHRFMPRIYKEPKYQPTNNENKFIHQHTEYFISKYIKRSRTIRSHKDFLLYDMERCFDAYIVGSDQCWRPIYNDKYLYEMYLNFAYKRENLIRIAYGASFGSDEWEYNEEQTRECSKLVKHFDLVTTREKSGIQLCLNHLNVNASHVLDPTLLLDRADYISLIENEAETKSEGSLFYYILDPTDEIMKFINRVSEENNLKKFKVLPLYKEEYRTKDDVKHRIDECVYPAVTKWLKAFYDAEMVIVDSFHGMVFSIIFNKPFWVLGNTQRGLSRFRSLLELFNLEDRIINTDKLYSVNINKKINWDSVNNILKEEKYKSLDLLFKYL